MKIYLEKCYTKNGQLLRTNIYMEDRLGNSLKVNSLGNEKQAENYFNDFAKITGAEKHTCKQVVKAA